MISSKIWKNKTTLGNTTICDYESKPKIFSDVDETKRSTLWPDSNTRSSQGTTRYLLFNSVIKLENIEYVHGCFNTIFTFLVNNLVAVKRFLRMFNTNFSLYTVSLKFTESIVIIIKQMILNPRLKETITSL
jgi:hypothetical protein